MGNQERRYEMKHHPEDRETAFNVLIAVIIFAIIGVITFSFLHFFNIRF